MSISKAVKVLLKEEDELEEYMNTAFFPGLRRSPRLEMEDLPERMFRIHVALQICSLIRGYQECLFFVSALQPVFNRDRFLRQAPALFEEKRPTSLVNSNVPDRMQKILSPRSKRFLSVLVNSQHFHQLLERLSIEETAFFHEVMEAIEGEEDPITGSKNNLTTTFGSTACEEAAQNLFETLERIEQNIPTYVVNRPGKPRRAPGALWTWDDSDEDFKIDPFVESNEPFWLLPEEKPPSIPFTHTVLQPILAGNTNGPASSSGEAGVHTLSLEYLVELEKNPWRYRSMLEMPMGDVKEEGSDGKQEDLQSMANRVLPRVKLCEAIGDNNFRAWKLANDLLDEEELNVTTPTEQPDNDGFDLSSILLNVTELPLDNKRSGGYERTQPRVDTKDRERVRQCLEKLFYLGQESINGDLIAEAELALRNPSAQRYLFSVLTTSVQRRKRSQEETKQRATTQQSVTRLEPNAFEGIVRLCYAVLEACTEEQNYESAYRLLTCTGGFCTSTTTTSTLSEQRTIYMTERISIHPVFADLRLWERVLLIHQQDQQNNDRKEDASENEEGEESTVDDVTTDEDITDNDAYDSVVTTLYEMVGYNVPAEEVSRFATRISEEKGWFATERGQALLVLARRLTAKRDEGDVEKSSGAGEFTTSTFVRKESGLSKDFGAGGIVDDAILESDDIAWSHPASCLVTYERQVGARAFLGNMLGGATESQIVGSNSSHGVHKIGSNSSHGVHKIGSNSSHGVYKSSSKKVILDANAGEYAGRVAITALASFGGSAVVTGGIDGSIFLAHTINFGGDTSSSSRSVNGVQLHWGAKGEEGRDSSSGSVTCIAASKGSGHRFGGGADKSSSNSGSDCYQDEEEIITSMDGCQIIAGTADGSLRAWSLRNVYHASSMAHRDNSPPTLNRSHHGSGATSVRLSGDDIGMQEALAGFPVGGHRGGVTCIDLPPRMYRPDSLVSGGQDGLIKLWSLKSALIDQDGGGQKKTVSSRFVQSHQMTSITDFDASDAQGVLTGHEGNIICIKTAWHGDKLLSGGADKTVRLWDLSVSVGKPLTTLRGHQGWVTETQFWGSNTIVSASTDRSIHLWDTRAGSSPIFALRYHLSPVSDLLLGNRSEPLMVSAGADGSLATWDFRVLSGTRLEPSSETNAGSDRAQSDRTKRSPMATMNHVDGVNSSVNCGSVKLARAIGRDDFSFFSVSDDGVVNEWEASSGCKMSTHDSGHRDAISGFSAFSSTDGLRQNKASGRGQTSTIGGTITCSWDGTVRLRRLARKPAH
jgi:WD40 repeat protein